MKFRKVEIQAFRAFNDVQDGTFDFTTKSNEVADFVAIYAPNGFGKTSFYDAIEWGFTNNISRLLRNEEDTDDSNDILKNKDSLKEGFVKLYVTSSDTPVCRKIPKHCDTEKDTIKDRKYFQQLILAQEWIDAFLKEDDASIRYNKFIRSFGDIHLNNNYKLIVELIKINDLKIEELDQELKILQGKLDMDLDPEMLSKINTEISWLNKIGETIPLMRPDCKEKDLHHLADLISERVIDLKYDLNTYQKESEMMDAANQKISSFEYYVKNELGINWPGVETATLKKTIEEKNNALKAKIIQTGSLIKSYEKTKEYKENLYPYLRHEELRRSKEEILKKKAFLQEKIAPKLEQERKNLSEYLDKQVGSFFHVKLINTLYRKIVPHPQYKEISFKCDFSADKPELNVFVTGENGNNPLVPASYFSTAQLNILSLSILLAKALNVKDDRGAPVDCIFIDDPIQSMESLNVLSTIDLLRSIVVNMGKQIILATHDENFRNLLQKKIPADKFKAKYIELETFGKVKQ